MRRATLLALVLIAGSAPPAAANDVQRWMDEMKVPVVPHLDVHIAPCPATNPQWPGPSDCAMPNGSVFISLDGPDFRLADRFELYHELGHQFDWQMANHRLRSYFRHVAERHGPWRGLLPELFADAYATCAFPRIAERREWLWDGRIEPDGYGYRAKWKPHRRFCRLLRSLGRTARPA